MSAEMAALSPLSAARVRGRLELQFHHQPQTDRTVLRLVDQHPPLRVIRAFPDQTGTTLVHLHNVSGGILGGDHLTLVATVGPHARAQLTTTGATRVYRHRPGRPPATQINHFIIEAGGLLEYLPDPLIPFAQARYEQATHVCLGQGAGLFWWEIVAPGRAAGGECFAYEQLNLTTTIKSGGRPIALEQMRLQPTHRPPLSMVRFGPYTYLATCYICRSGLPAQTWLDLERDLAGLADQLSSPSETIWSASALVRDGLIVRGLSQSGRPLSEGLAMFRQAAGQRLYGAVSQLPRKVY